MNFKSLTDENLLTEFGGLVRTERKITHHILLFINEIDRRQLYLERAYPSLFEFLTKKFGYSAGSAMRRIDGARLLRDIPEVAEKIKTGAINLSQASQIQRAVREVKKIENRKVGVEEKKELLLKIENTNQRQSEQVIAHSLRIPVPHQQKYTTHRDESVSLTITFNKEQMNLLEQASQMISHCVPSKNWAEVVTHLAQKEIKRRTHKEKQIPM